MIGVVVVVVAVAGAEIPISDMPPPLLHPATSISGQHNRHTREISPSRTLCIRISIQNSFPLSFGRTGHASEFSLH
jgi:hypothetical protein